MGIRCINTCSYIISPTKTYIVEYKLPTVMSLFEKVFNLKNIHWTYFLKSKNRKRLIRTAYKIALLKAGTIINTAEVYTWYSQVLGTLYSLNLFEFDRLIKAKINYKKKKKD